MSRVNRVLNSGAGLKCPGMRLIPLIVLCLFSISPANRSQLKAADPAASLKPANTAAVESNSLTIPKRQPWSTSRIAGSPDPPPPYRVELAFPELKFKDPLDLCNLPGSSRLFVAEQTGRILSFENDPTVSTADLVIDLKASHPELSALYALTFHPKFEQNRYVYVCYIQGNDKPDGTFVSRFEMSNADPPVIDPSTEQVIIRWWAGGHNGCCLKFGPDGFLYISTGDGGAPSPPDPLMAGQDVSNLLSNILRINVDRQDGDKNYAVPPDNPLIGIEGARPEIWAFGFRNPWRMSFDKVRGDLWVGDVGWQLWEMIYRVERGGNYGWPIMEGPQPALPESKRGPTPILPPTVSHPHSEAASITGGYVYHGDRLPELRDVYIYGDFQTGRVWGIRHDGKQVTWQKELAQTPLQLVSFAEDNSGELYLLDYQRTHQVYRLVPNPSDGKHADFPRRLSETGLFTSLRELTPAAGVTPYKINAAQWADSAWSQRWMGVPGADPVQVGADGHWTFPDGAVLVKTISIETKHGDPKSARRLETQILHRQDETWRPYSYIWNDDQSDAELGSAAGSSRTLRILDDRQSDGFREQVWRFASRGECQMCHNPWVEKKTSVTGIQTASPLAVSVGQLDCSLASVGFESSASGPSSGESGANQLELLQQQGWIAGTVAPASGESAAGKFVDPYDTHADLNQRVRSYLHVNCAHCHQPHAGGTATIELMIEAKLEDAKVLDVRPAQGAFGISHARIIAPSDPLGSVLHYRMTKAGSGRMPRIGSEEVDERAVQMIHDWIAQLPSAAAQPETRETQKEDQAAIAMLKSDDAAQRVAALQQLTSSTRGALALLSLVQKGQLPDQARQEALALTTQHPQPEVRDLFERFIPASLRLKRLGNNINMDDILTQASSAERGRQLFFREGAASCKSCHRVNGTGELLGPDLSSIGKKYPARDLLTHLLEPSRFIDPKYVPYVLETVDGHVHTGLLVERNDQQVILRNAQNKEVRVPVKDVEVLVSQQKSLMPDLLLRDMTAQEAADLVAFLGSLRQDEVPASK